MSYEPDYIHMKNIIVRAIEATAISGANGNHEAATAEFAVLIDFLEHMYCDSLVAFAGVMLKTTEEMEEESATEVFEIVRDLLDKVPANVFVRINKNYQEMIGQLKLPDAYSGEKHV